MFLDYEMILIFNFGQVEVSFFGFEVGCLRFIFQFSAFTVVTFRYPSHFRRTLLKKHRVSQHERPISIEFFVQKNEMLRIYSSVK